MHQNLKFMKFICHLTVLLVFNKASMRGSPARTCHKIGPPQLQQVWVSLQELCEHHVVTKQHIKRRVSYLWFHQPQKKEKLYESAIKLDIFDYTKGMLHWDLLSSAAFVATQEIYKPLGRIPSKVKATSDLTLKDTEGWIARTCRIMRGHCTERLKAKSTTAHTLGLSSQLAHCIL